MNSKNFALNTYAHDKTKKKGEKEKRVKVQWKFDKTTRTSGKSCVDVFVDTLVHWALMKTPGYPQETREKNQESLRPFFRPLDPIVGP